MSSATSGEDLPDSCVGSENGTQKACEGHEVNSQNGSTNDMTLAEQSIESSGTNNLEPYTGMAFPSLDDARDFYYEYAKRIGFTIRTSRIRHASRGMAVIGRDFVCSREGFRSPKYALRKDRIRPPRPITREGCKAMIRLALKDGKWIVSKFVKEHNHPFMYQLKYSGEWSTGTTISEEEKDKKIQDLYDELQQERNRSAAIQQQLSMILKDLEEHASFMSLRVEDIVKNMKEIELGNL